MGEIALQEDCNTDGPKEKCLAGHAHSGADTSLGLETVLIWPYLIRQLGNRQTKE